MSAQLSAHPITSLLFLPASNPRAIEKARSLECDAVILDLEDAVAPDAKATARAAACAELAAHGAADRPLIVRINALDTPWGQDDLRAVIEAGARIVLAPKVSTAADVAALDTYLAGHDIALWVMIETPMAVLKLDEIGAQAAHGALAAFVLGTNDLAKDLHARLDTARTAFAPFLALTVAAARAYGLRVFDGVYNDIEDEDGLLTQARQAAAFGFDGKGLIHPRQIEPCHRGFAPDAAEVARAERIIAAFEAPESVGKGAIRVDGKMVERLHLIEAHAIIARARRDT